MGQREREGERGGRHGDREIGEGERNGEIAATNCIYRPQRSVTEALCRFLFVCLFCFFFDTGGVTC